MEFSKRLEVAANGAILCLCLMLMGILAWKLVLPKGTSTARNQVPIGKTLKLPGVDWSTANGAVVLALSTQCHYCTESAPFYKKLVEASQAKQVRVIAVLPQARSESQQYLQTHQISVQEIVQTQLPAIYVKATPTVLFVDRTGVVIDGWVGKLSPEHEQEMLRRSRDHDSAVKH